MDTYVVMIGNPVDGVALHGPFDDGNDAGDWAERFYANDTWWIVKVRAPKTAHTPQPYGVSWRIVTNVLLSAGGIGGSTITSGAVRVYATSEAEAESAARALVEQEPMYDPRVDPRIVIDDIVELVDELVEED